MFFRNEAPQYMCVKERNPFPGKQKFDSKTQDMFDDFQQKYFFESFP